MPNIILSEEEYNELKKKAVDSDYYKERTGLLEEKLNRAEKLLSEELGKSDSWKRDYERIREQFLCPLYDILYPDNPNLDINVTNLLNDVKDLKVYADENGRMYKELQEWREKWIALKAHDEARGNDIGRLISVNKKLDNKISELQNIVTEKEVEIKELKKDIIALTYDRRNSKDIIKKNAKLNQTISDQEVIIKALLITIKEMCKEDETNE